MDEINKRPQSTAFLPLGTIVNRVAEGVTIRRYRTDWPGQFGARKYHIECTDAVNAIIHDLFPWYGNCIT